MSTVKKLLFGETWLLPIGLAAALAGSLLVRRLLGEDWHAVGGFVLLAGVAAVLLLSVARGGRPKR